MTDVALSHETAPASDHFERERAEPEKTRRPGTPEFMSYELFRYVKTRVIHRVYHDLESYYWVFVWIVLRHTRHNLGQAKAKSVFNHDAALQAKCCWLMVQGKIFGEHLAIDGNTPLTELMTEFKSLVVKMTTAHYDGEFLTHEAVLRALDDALGQAGWPQEDDRVEFTYRKPVPQIRVLWASKSCILAKRSRAAAGLDVTPSIHREDTGADPGPSTASENESNPKRLKSREEAATVQ